MTVILRGEVYDIATEIFAALVDGEAGALAPWPDGVPTGEHDVAAWVDVHGPWPGRASIETSADTAAALARALLRLRPDASVTADDLVDALGEVANVVAGNVKALLPELGTLGLPRVGPGLPAYGADALQRVPLEWRGRSLVLTVWTTNDEGTAGGAARPDRWEDR